MDTFDIALRLGIAALAGVALGLNRDLHGKPMGVRTLGLVGLGSALAVLAIGESSSADASRVIQGIVTGIGFLGAGVIIRNNEGQRVHGLTTAACAWLTACIGATCGLGQWRIVALSAPLVFLILVFGGHFEKAIHRRWPGHGTKDPNYPQETVMYAVRDPILEPVSIASLRPTQITVGMCEVNDKQERLRKHPPGKIGKFLGHHMIPVILGPKDCSYIIDHHHLALALLKEGVEKVLVTTVSDLSALKLDEFWAVLDHRNWVYPFDARGRRRPFQDIPKSVTDLADDPFRSLAGELRRVGGFSKETTPFSEFLWADFLRRRLKRKLVRTRERCRASVAGGEYCELNYAGGYVFDVRDPAHPRVVGAAPRRKMGRRG